MEGSLKLSISELLKQYPVPANWASVSVISQWVAMDYPAETGNPTWGSIARTLTEMGKTISRGWTKGTLIDLNGMCMLGAYVHGTGMLRNRESVEGEVIGSLLEEIIRQEMEVGDMPRSYSSWNVVVWFNDEQGTTKEDVLHVIGRALKIVHGLENTGGKVTIPERRSSFNSALAPYPTVVPCFPVPALVTAGV